MTVDELKQEISEKTGIHVNILPGDNPREVIENARGLLKMKNTPEPQTTREKFAAWLGAAYGEPDDPGFSALDEIEKHMVNSYPVVNDGGETHPLPDSRPARERFEDWVSPQFAYNPKRDGPFR